MNILKKNHIYLLILLIYHIYVYLILSLTLVVVLFFCVCCRCCLYLSVEQGGRHPHSGRTRWPGRWVSIRSLNQSVQSITVNLCKCLSYYLNLSFWIFVIYFFIYTICVAICSELSCVIIIFRSQCVYNAFFNIGLYTVITVYAPCPIYFAVTFSFLTFGFFCFFGVVVFHLLYVLTLIGAYVSFWGGTGAKMRYSQCLRETERRNSLENKSFRI